MSQGHGRNDAGRANFEGNDQHSRLAEASVARYQGAAKGHSASSDPLQYRQNHGNPFLRSPPGASFRPANKDNYGMGGRGADEIRGDAKVRASAPSVSAKADAPQGQGSVSGQTVKEEEEIEEEIVARDVCMDDDDDDREGMRHVGSDSFASTGSAASPDRSHDFGNKSGYVCSFLCMYVYVLNLCDVC
jgi:hypothetical protein